MSDDYTYTYTYLPVYLPVPHELVVREAVKPALPFGFCRQSCVQWSPCGPERHVRDKATVEWACRMRSEQ